MKWLWALMLAAWPAMGQDMGSGERNFDIYCSGCHGEDATGDGVVAMTVDTPPPDLTRLAERNGGVFPRAKVVYQIDGRDPVPAHEREMPEYGDLLEGPTQAMKTAAGQPILTSVAIVELVEWLESVQR
ncbi:c-type cytochrome [Psychromarinibacter sp. C21-152]|uniref:C-type cytochrome n=1 Tax=Psychromarinibacter sediminicola TaxID=3033385 RepID=A0AAE3NM12_9RHOB|nr:c-type cytochrome [Psychromarinibacter sediminicola]MDF0600333.1 c-type cytochrome [Psychromarinibacter sediminicola]